MSKKDDTKFSEENPEVTSISPYENISLQYKSESENGVSDSQLRLACLEASVAFHDNHEDEDSSTIVDTAKQFWQFVNGAKQ